MKRVGKHSVLVFTLRYILMPVENRRRLFGVVLQNIMSSAIGSVRKVNQTVIEFLLALYFPSKSGPVFPEHYTGETGIGQVWTVRMNSEGERMGILRNFFRDCRCFVSPEIM